jgi:hypothetical protein
MPRADIIVDRGLSFFTFGGTTRLVQTPSGVLYCLYVNLLFDLTLKKSTDGGLTWSNPTTVYTGTVLSLAVWYDRWSDIDAGLIHLAYSQAETQGIRYRTIDTENNDALGVETVVFAGVSTAGNGGLSIVVAGGGNIIVAGAIDAGAEDGAWQSTDAGATWAAISDPSEGGTTDQYMLLPGWNADTQDVMLIFWDASADELSVKRYDDSANAWAETLISASMVDQTPINAYPNLASIVDIANSRNIIIAWSAVDTANADLRCWLIDNTTITEVTNVVQNSVDDQGLAGLSFDTLTNNLFAFYAGKSDGSQEYMTNAGLYYKVVYSTADLSQLYASGGLLQLGFCKDVFRRK